MKKVILISLSALLLTACADKQQYEQAVIAEMKNEQDIKDYKIDPIEMADCVVDVSSKGMPGLFPFDPARLTAYQKYTKMLAMSSAKDKQKTFEELRKTFGTPQEHLEARNNYASSITTCTNIFIQRAEKDEESEAE